MGHDTAAVLILHVVGKRDGVSLDDHVHVQRGDAALQLAVEEQIAGEAADDVDGEVHLVDLATHQFEQKVLDRRQRLTQPRCQFAWPRARAMSPHPRA